MKSETKYVCITPVKVSNKGKIKFDESTIVKTEKEE